MMSVPSLRFLLSVLLCGAALTIGQAQKAPASSVPAAANVAAAPIDAAGIEFFESKVRPVLAERCYGCHSHATQKAMGNLYLDSREAMIRGGKRGSALLPGEPVRTRLLQAIRYTQPDLK